MENLILGIITTVIVSVGYFFAFRKFRPYNYRLSLSLLLLCGLMLRIYTASDRYIHEWDERYHALVAKNMVEDPLEPKLYKTPLLPYDYKIWTINHIWLHKQPLALWTMAGSMSLFGTNEFGLRFPSLLISTLGILLTFIIGKYLFGTRVGFMAAFFHSIHGYIIELASGRAATDHIDTFFFFYIELGVLLAIKFAQTRKSHWNILCGLSIGAAILSKWLPALIVLPIWLFLMIRHKLSYKRIIKNGLLLCITIIAVALPWQLYASGKFPQEYTWESHMNFRHLTEAVEHHNGSFLFHFERMGLMYGQIIYLPVIWFLWKSFKRINNLNRQIIATWLLIPYLFFSFVATKMPAYTIFTAPAIFIITALLWYYLKIYRRRFKHTWLINIALVLLILLPVRYSIERSKVLWIRERQPAWVTDLKQLEDKYKGEKWVLFNAEHYIEAMFYTNGIAYPYIPRSKKIEELHEHGYQIVIVDKGDLNEELKSLDYIITVNLEVGI